MSKIRQRNKRMIIENPSSLQHEMPYAEMNFGKMRVGSKVLDDAIVNIGALKKVDRNLTDKDRIMSAIDNNDIEYLRKVSSFFYNMCGMYKRLVEHLASLYRYDWMVVPYINSSATSIKEDKILADFSKVLLYLDNSELKRLFNDIALKVVLNGAYYGYRIDTGQKSLMQELPPQYCRSRFFVNGRPLVEFNVKFFDDNFKDANQRINVLKSFPKEFAKGYVAHKEGRIKKEPGDNGDWIVLDSEYAVKFSMGISEIPFMVSVIPAIIDLDEAKGIDRKKMTQELLKIVIQKMPFDKNGELIFDVDEAQDLHNNAVAMLSKAVGVDILTTFADIEVANMSDRNSASTKDDLQKVERGVYNEAGISQMLFATDGNLALEKSLNNDEAMMYTLLLDFESYLNVILDSFNNNPKKLYFRANLLTTTIYNYEKMAKAYKEQATLGYSKMLPQIALGQSQSSILATAFFENDILKLSELMIPLQSSNTMSKAETGGEKKNGKPEKPDDQKAEKTIMNKESMS